MRTYSDAIRFHVFTAAGSIILCNPVEGSESKITASPAKSIKTKWMSLTIEKTDRLHNLKGPYHFVHDLIYGTSG